VSHGGVVTEKLVWQRVWVVGRVACRWVCMCLCAWGFGAFRPQRQVGAPTVAGWLARRGIVPKRGSGGRIGPRRFAGERRVGGRWAANQRARCGHGMRRPVGWARRPRRSPGRTSCCSWPVSVPPCGRVVGEPCGRVAARVRECERAAAIRGDAKAWVAYQQSLVSAGAGRSARPGAARTPTDFRELSRLSEQKQQAAKAAIRPDRDESQGRNSAPGSRSKAAIRTPGSEP
jgi:hypothetical protein